MSVASHIIVEIGSSPFSHEDGGLDLNRISSVARLVARWRETDREIVIVSSGAVATGLDSLGFTSKPKDLPSVQAAAAVDQGLLMAQWTAAFQAHHLDTAQVPLTTDDVIRRGHYTNVRASLTRLLGLGIIPILNGNGAVTTHELRFGGNNRLAMLTAQMIEADALILLIDVNGLCAAPPGHPGSKPTERVESMGNLMSVLVTGADSRVDTDSIATKVQTAVLVSTSGIGVRLASTDALKSVLVGKNVGTWFELSRECPASRRLWIVHVAPSRGEIIVDKGAAQAITAGKKSLLVVGVRSVLGHFKADDIVDTASPTGLVARGVSGYDSDTLAEIARSDIMELQAAGHEYPKPTIHRDGLAVLSGAFSTLSAD